MSGIDFWVNNPNFRLFPPDNDDQPAWCHDSRQLVEWGDNLLDRLSRDPAEGKVGFAKWKLFDRYRWLYHKAEKEHRAETNLDNHPCLHQALMLIADKLDDLQVQAAIPELEPPQVQVITQAVESVPEVLDEDAGIVIDRGEEDES